MTIEIDGVPVPAGGTILDACRSAGADVPTLCHDERTTAGGHCRTCMVEVDGRMAPSCTTIAVDGTRVATDSQRLRDYRRDLGELMLAECAPEGRARRLIGSWGARGDRYQRAARAEPARRDVTHPHLALDLAACILCRKCVAACDEIQGQFVLAVAGRGEGSRVTWGAGDFASSSCVSCGACAQACPSGAISDVDRVAASRAVAAPPVRTTCGFCGVGCQMDVHPSAGRIAWIDGAPSPVNDGHLCGKGRYAHAFSRHPERLTRPLARVGSRFEPVDWDDAIAIVARELDRARGHVAGLSSSRCTNEENYLFQKLMRVALGTNDVDCCARVCHAPSAAGMLASFGTAAATNSLDDIEKSDLLLVAGANPTEAHPVTGARIKQAVLRGATLVVVDPRRTELAAMADVHLAPRPGTNVPLFNGLAAVIVEEGLVDAGFVASRTAGWPDFERFVRRFRPEEWESTTRVPAADVRRAARLYSRARAPMQLHGLGVTEHLQGSEAVMLLCNLALLRGAVGREGVGVNPLRGQNNVQGAADMGCAPDGLPGHSRTDDAEACDRFAAAWGRALPTAAGRTLPRMFEAIDTGEIRAMYLLGEDVVQTDPDADRVRARLRKLDFLVVQELFLSETAKLADIVLPGAAFLEKDGTFTNGERRIQRVRRVVEPIGRARPDWRILLDLMAALGAPQRMDSPREIWDEVRRVAPPFADASYEAIERAGLQWPVTADAPQGTTTLHAPAFARGPGVFRQVEFIPSPALGGDEGELLLVTGRALDHYNSGSMTRRSKCIELALADYLDIHPEDAAARAIAAGDRVRIASSHGEAHSVARLGGTVAPGTVFLTFHFPATGTNRVTSGVVDRLSDCPEYKVTSVRVTKE